VTLDNQQPTDQLAVVEMKQEVPVTMGGQAGLKLVNVRQVFPLHATLADVLELAKSKNQDQVGVSFTTHAHPSHLLLVPKEPPQVEG